METPVIVGAVRTPMGKYNGTLAKLSAPDLGALVIKEAINRAGLGLDEVDEVIMGNVVQAGLGQNPARQAMLSAGVTELIGAMTINKVCGSGMKAMTLASNSIKVGETKTVVVGGMESMTNCPYLLQKARFGYRLNDGKLVDAMVNDGLWDSYNNFHMIVTGEIIAEKFNITREDTDKIAVRSNVLAAKATEEGRFKNEIVPVEIKGRKGAVTIFEDDEGFRADTTMESLGRLRPVMKEGGVVTAGNASQLSDGASALVIMAESEADKRGIKPLARIAGYHFGGLKPELVMEAPIPVTRQLLERMNLTIEDMDLVEHNEAFASASCAVIKELGIPEEKFNVNGGAVALGHPIGSSGSRIMITLLYALMNRGLKRGLGTICLGGGNAVSMVIETM